MATPELAIAKAALSASLFRADPISISRPSVDTFIQQLSSTLTQCSRPNVQNCKDYILSNIVHSTGRSASLAKYLIALSKAQVDAQKPSAKRRRLHILYIINDVLHHVARQEKTEYIASVDAYLPPLISSAASFDNCPKHIKKLHDLISMWASKSYVPDTTIPKLKEALAGSSISAPEPTTSSFKLAKDAPFILPSFHGDPSTAWYDLPAATWLPHLVPNSTKPMLPDLIRPIQLAPGPADKILTTAVKALLSDADRLFSKEKGLDDDPHIDINELGERITLDEITGDIVNGETYYGWSRQFCQRMKDRRKTKQRGRSMSRSSDGSYSRGRSSSRSYKRRRTSRSRSRSRRSYTPRSNSRSRSRSQSRSRSRSRRQPYSPSRSRSRSPRRRTPRSPSPQPQPSVPNMPFMPIPPPPAGYTGPWPPPPPPPMPGAPPQGWVPDPALAAQMMGAWNGQVPPLPPQIQGQYNNNYNSRGGYDGFRGRGRGYYRGGRGYNRGR